MIESINLNLIPSGVSPVCHVSQYDEGRQIKINLFEGINPYTIQSGDSFTLNVRKPDNTIVTTSVSGTQGNNYITISTTEQIAAVVGENLCELKITNGSTVIGTLNFVMLVERDVLADGIPSQSVIEDLDERIAEAIGDNYYNKTEADDLLALKADKSELYNVYPTEQESGAIAHFTDGADNIPVKSLSSQIVAVESGSGTPSPSNPRAISGFDNGVITRCGKNLFNVSAYSDWNIITAYAVQKNVLKKSVRATMCFSDKDTSVDVTGCYIGFIDNGYSGETLSGTVYRWTMSNGIIQNVKQNYSNDDTSNFLGGVFIFPRTEATYNKIFSRWNISIVLGTSELPFEAYNGNTYEFAFGQTVYGGYFDNKGNLVVTHSIVDLSTLSWSYASDAKRWRAIKSDMKNYQSRSDDIIFEKYDTDTSATTGSENKGYISGAYIYVHSTDDMTQPGGNARYPLATPITLSITSQDIPTLLGENNIYSDTGDVDVTIRADIGLYIDKRLNANRSTPNNLSRAAAYVDDPESVNESQEDNVETQNEDR